MNIFRHDRMIRFLLRRHLTAALVVAILGFAQSVAANDTLVPQARISITAVQWVEAEGGFRHWPELEGEFEIAGDGTIRLPKLGSISAAGQMASHVAAEIGARFAQEVGLKVAPDVIVTVAEYPPIFLVGDIVAPGQYAFTPGLTVLKALAMGGGLQRPNSAVIETRVTLIGELESLSAQILRAEARIARLEAEQRGANAIDFPQNLSHTDPAGMARETASEETALFEARANGLRRQRAALDELTKLLDTEIEVLGEKAAMLDAVIARTDDELQGVRSLVDRGVVIVERRSQLETNLSNLRVQRLDQTTATTRVRQGLAAAKRDRIAFAEEWQATVTAELQNARADVERLRILLDVAQRRLLLAGPAPGTADRDIFRYFIIRPWGDRQDTITANEATALAPGDVLKVEKPDSDILAGQSTEFSLLADSNR